MRRSLTLLAAIAGSVLALDLGTKRWAIAHLADRAPVEILGPFVRLTYTLNSGVAFGLGAGHRFPYYLFSIAAVAVIFYLFLRQRVQSLGRQIALALIMGGALGNLVDRLKSGMVVDFIEIGWSRWHWPVFNVADSAVTLGVALFALTWPGRGPEMAAEHAVDPATPAPVRAEPRNPTPPTFDEPDARSIGTGAERG